MAGILSLRLKRLRVVRRSRHRYDVRRFGIHFRNQLDSCIECDACDNVCPVDLLPRDLMAAASPRAGIAIADAPGRNHCLECGDCVRACARPDKELRPEFLPLQVRKFPQKLADCSSHCQRRRQTNPKDLPIPNL